MFNHTAYTTVDWRFQASFEAPCASSTTSLLLLPSATIPTIPARIKRTRQFPFPDTNTLPSILPLLLSILLLLHPTASHSFSLLPLYQKPFFPEHRSLCTSPHSFIHLSKQRLTHDSLVHTHHSQPFYAERDNTGKRKHSVCLTRRVALISFSLSLFLPCNLFCREWLHCLSAQNAWSLIVVPNKANVLLCDRRNDLKHTPLQHDFNIPIELL